MAKSNAAWARQFRAVSAAEFKSAEVITEAYELGHTSKWLNSRLLDIRLGLDVYPKYLREQLREYQRGYRHCFEEDKLAFLYLWKGKFYRTSNCPAWAMSVFPSWETISNEHWMTITQYGSIYWVYPDGRRPALNFNSCEDSDE
jgi:hypothetical protein